MTDIDLTAAVEAGSAGIEERLKWASNHWNAAALDPAAHIYLASAALEAALPHIERQYVKANQAAVLPYVEAWIELNLGSELGLGGLSSLDTFTFQRKDIPQIVNAILARMPGKPEAEVMAEAWQEGHGNPCDEWVVDGMCAKYHPNPYIKGD